jgi:membrane glycosyltransferase
MACASGIRHPHRSAAALILRERLVTTLLTKGPDAVPDVQKNALLADPVFLAKLHFAVWTSPQAHAVWKQAVGLQSTDGEGKLQRAA